MSKIEWTDVTWNPTRGCRRVSPGCENCYAEGQAHRQSGHGGAYEGLTVLGSGGPRWNGNAREVPDQLDKPLHWRKPRRVFVDSMSDLFYEGFSFEFIAAVFGVMAACPQHTFQILTKRPERMAEWFEWVHDQDRGKEGTSGRLHAIAAALDAEADHHPAGYGGPLHTKHCADPDGPWPLPNVWLGVSVESQEYVGRVGKLLESPAVIRFVSAEPLLGGLGLDGPRRGEWKCRKCGLLLHTRNINMGDSTVTVRTKLERNDCQNGCGVMGQATLLDSIDWVIVGGESGRRARSMELKWATSLVEQCQTAGVPVFVKQLGAAPVVQYNEDYFDEVPISDRKGAVMTDWPEPLRVREFPELHHG